MAGVIVLRQVVGWNRALVVTAYYTVIIAVCVLSLNGPVTWTARWEEAKFFTAGVAATTVVRELSSGHLLVRFIATNGRWHTASVDPVTRVTSNGVRIPDDIKF
jgi:hypothetical protein